jgi:hypothetical protein
MKRESVSSSSIASIGYNVATKTLEIEFKSGTIYQYFDVPEYVHSALMSSGSIGQYFNSIIKGSYRYSRV